MSTFWLEMLGGEVRYYDAGGVRTRCLEAGSGPALVLLHGTGGHAESWIRNVLPLGAHFRVYAIDMVGHGFSDKPNPDIITPDHLRRVPHPTLVLWTSDNPGTTWQEAEGAADLLPRGQFRLLGDCAHWPQYEQADEYNRVVTEFLRG